MGEKGLGNVCVQSISTIFCYRSSLSENLKIEHFKSEMMISDFLTKPLQGSKFTELFSKL